ncbi:toxin-antitoxin system YwqK family antitoxin [Aquimarina litoralis]|uniref:toxin-antitoxin system YwqK family antitoxin n=1 Tax=Aquimarina litoralis TaxID=584605 RepID=UPI001C57BB86|nr:toxin-antitoxin system YwqK family antitoxin [Aquimarina litoralis]MBW1299016.1 membrane-binding protein [Aquimarina litoralis]
MKCNIIALFIVNILLTSCVKQIEEKSSDIYNPTNLVSQIPNRTMDRSFLMYDNKNSLWRTLKGKLYSGYIVSYYEENKPKEKASVLNGKKQSQTIRWYPDGHLKELANYYKGKLHGEKKIWSSDTSHILISHLNYFLGKAHGEQKQWYPTGELYKKMNLNMGREEGIQQAFRKNGDLYANYEAKNGRIFGLKKTMLCYGLEDENIKYKE